LDQALAVSQAFSLAKLRILRLLFQNCSFGTASNEKVFMKKVITPLLLFFGIVFSVSGQGREPIDLILVLDASSSMSGSYREASGYVSGPFLKKFLRIGDTFHLISFSGSPRLEISRRIEGAGDVETVIGRLFLMLPLDPYTDIAGALAYTERYVLGIPSSRHKTVVFVTDGEQNPEPGASAAVQDSGALAGETAARLRRTGADFHWVTFPPAESASSRTGPPPDPPAEARRADPPPPVQAERRPFNYALLFILLGLILLLILGLIIFFISRKFKSSQDKQGAGKDSNKDGVRGGEEEAGRAAGLGHEKIPPVSLLGKDEKAGGRSSAKETLLVALVVDDQNTNIGRRNIHSLKAGDVYTVGGGKLDDYFIFLAPVPAHIGDIQFNGEECTFIPKKPEYFPETGARPVPGCLGKNIRVISDGRYELTLHFEQYEESLNPLNRLLNSAAPPPKPPEEEEKS
jgi:hypothetical protein